MICENCGKEHDGSYGSGRFCSKFCAKSFSTKNDDNKIKETNCIECGKSIYIYKRISPINCKCNDCKSKKIKYCKICGRKFITNSKKVICNNEFCQTHNIQQLNTLLKYFNFDKNKIGTQEVETEFNKIRDNLYDLYWNKHLSSTEICKLFNYPNICNLTNKVFNYLGIKHKTCKESIEENYLEGRLLVKSGKQYKHGYHITWNNKKVYLRSSYEFDYAKLLDKQKINYEVENLRIKYWDSQKNKYRCAIPDFYIPSENLIIEIKSTYTLDKINMVDKKKQYLNLGYNFKCICDHKEINI